MQRRTFLAAGAAGLAVTPGCTGLLEDDDGTNEVDPSSLDFVEDPPDAVYVPGHVEGMEMVGMQMVGDFSVALSYARPHRFWLMDGDETQEVEREDDDSAHLMVTLWDGETDTVLPVESEPTAEVLDDEGNFVDERTPWPMLSQTMGFHYGDNVKLEGDGTYEVTVRIPPVTADRFGDFDGRFEEWGETTFELEFEQSTLDGLMDNHPDDSGEPGAADQMEMDMMPTSTVPDPEDLPGELLGQGESGDADFVATLLEEGPNGEAPYLAVSPRTPYNASPIPNMSLSATVTRDGDAVFDDDLNTAIGPDVGFVYGAGVEGVESGDELTVSVDSPTQASRHQGYETAFLEMPDVTIDVE